MRADGCVGAGKSIAVQKLISTLLILTVAFTFVTSSASLSCELHHDCTGDGCAVCAEMATGLHLVRGGFSTPGAAVALSAAFLIFAFLPFGSICRRVWLMTLVALKVQLND